MANSEYMTAAEAQEYLGVSKPTMAKLLGTLENSDASALKWEFSPVDGRVKIIKRIDVERLAAKAPQIKKDAA